MPDSVDPDRPPTPEKQRGPVTLRRGQVSASTTDERLLDVRGPSDWVHTDPWRVLRIQSEFVEGFGALAELGSTATKPLVVRLDGNKVEEGRAILRDANHPLVTLADTMDEGADKAAELANA